MKLPKIPIDYSKAGTGETPFTEELVIIHFLNMGKASIIAWYDDDEKCFVIPHSGSEIHIDEVRPTHYSPMPEFEEVEGGEA